MKPDLTRERVLLFHLPADSEKGRLVRQAIGALRIHAVDIRPDQLSQTVGYCAGLHGFGPNDHPAPTDPVDEEALIMSGLSDEKINRLLGLLRKTGAAPIGLMAVVTEHNRAWPMSMLITELIRERRVMAFWFSLQSTVRAAQALEDAGHFTAVGPDRADAFQAALAAAKDILSTEEPPEPEQIQAADIALKAFL